MRLAAAAIVLLLAAWPPGGACDGTGADQLPPEALAAGLSGPVARELERAYSDGLGSRFVETAAGEQFTLALRAEGTIRVWGAGPVVDLLPVGLQGVTRLAAGAAHAVAMFNDGSLRAWGAGPGALVPDGLRDARDVAAGGAHTLVILKNGTVRAFGADEAGQSTVPVGLENVRQLGGGRAHSLALLADGTVRAWGSNEHGQCNVPRELQGPMVVNGSAVVTVARSVAAGASFSAAALGDGSVLVWGLWNGRVQTQRYYIALTMKQAVSLVQIAAGEGHVVVRAHDPSGIFVLGDNSYGQTNVPRTLVFPQRTTMLNVAAGSYHNALLMVDGSLFLWGCRGASNFGQCARPNPCSDSNGGCAANALCTNDQGRAKCSCRANHIGDGRTCLLAASPLYRQVASKGNYTVAVMSDGTVQAWGTYSNGTKATVPANLRGVVRVAAGFLHTVALLRTGDLVGWGPGPGSARVPPRIPGIKDITAGAGFSAALDANGTVHVWGNRRATQTALQGLTGAAQVSAGNDHVLVLMRDGTVQAFGFGNGDPSGKATVPKGLKGVAAVSAGYDHSLVLLKNGSVVAFGADDKGQRNMPPGVSGAVAVVAGEKRSAAVLAGSRVVAWGANDAAQTTALALGDTEGLAQLAVGSVHAVGLMPDGTLRVFCGNNDEGGQCDPPEPCAAVRGVCSPHALCTGSDHVATCVCKAGFRGSGKVCAPSETARIKQVVAGYSSAAAVFHDGTVRAWGKYFTDVPPDLQGKVKQLSAGPGYYVALTDTGTLRAWGETAAQVMLPLNLTGVRQVSVAKALLENGTVVAWGSNLRDQGTVPDGLSGVAHVSSSGIHTLALRTDGTVFSWGDPNLSDADYAGSLQGVAQVSASPTHNLALLSNGTVVAWGGFNFFREREVPAGLGKVKQVEAGVSYSLALLETGRVAAWGRNSTGQLAVPPDLDAVVQVTAGERYAMALKADGSLVAWGTEAEVPADLRA
ncbi:regulator of chromosome condensation 1/beta-lactamase-inhibitor protein II [Hyaloraphidium curvatum]|nr:regulator of chromosome condensation 1/beta-lactamase-inhibitor protein II [Hyaloraphidium curvatum]